MDITKVLAKISDKRTIAIMDGNTSIGNQLEKLMAITISISKLSDSKHSTDFEERQELIKSFEEELAKVPNRGLATNRVKSARILTFT